MSFIYLVKLISVKLCFVHFGANSLKSAVVYFYCLLWTTVWYGFLQNFVNLYNLIQKCYGVW